MIVVIGLSVSSRILSRSGCAPARILGVDDDDALGGDEDGGVAAAALEHEQVVLELLDFDDARLLAGRRLLLQGGHGDGEGAGSEEHSEQCESFHGPRGYHYPG